MSHEENCKKLSFDVQILRVQELAKWCSPLKAGSAWDRRDQQRVGTTRKVRVVIEGVGYESISAAARALGRSTVAVDLMLRDGRAMKA